MFINKYVFKYVKFAYFSNNNTWLLSR